MLIEAQFLPSHRRQETKVLSSGFGQNKLKFLAAWSSPREALEEGGHNPMDVSLSCQNLWRCSFILYQPMLRPLGEEAQRCLAGLARESLHQTAPPSGLAPTGSLRTRAVDGLSERWTVSQ